MKDRYSLLVGLVFLVLIGIATLNTLGGDEEGTLGLDRMPDRWPLPAFAVPDARGSIDADANVAQDDCETSLVPCPEASRRTPACRIPRRGAIRVCDYFDRPLALSFWFGTDNECVAQQDALDRAAARYRDRVSFLSLNVRGSREEVRRLVRQRGWGMPVGYDRDGAVASLYRVAGCPTIAFAYPGGTLHSAAFGYVDDAGLSARLGRLLSATARAEGAAP